MSKKKVLLLAAVTLLMTANGYSFPGYGQNKDSAQGHADVKETGLGASRSTDAQTAEAPVDQLIPRIHVEGEFADEGSSIRRLRDRGVQGQASVLAREYAREFAGLDVDQVKADLKAVMTDSKEFWPADYGYYGPLFIRLAWHSAGTYRAIDGRGGSDGGQMRFYPLADWPDNANLDKARQLIQPVVDKYYPKLSWADAMVLVGDLAMEDMGFDTLGVAFGRIDDVGPDMVYWGPEDAFLKSERFDKKGNLQLPLAASVMGLIYVNPEGPDGKPDPLLSAERIRLTFGRMGMNDEETVALIAGGHTFGKAHGSPRPPECMARGENAPCPEAKGASANTSGIEGSWTPKPIEWTHAYLTNLYKYNWKLTKGPGGKYQWYAEDLEPSDLAPDAHDAGKSVPIMMLTTDLALRYDTEYNKIARRFLENPDEFGAAFARAWFKLVHRDLGPKSRYLGSDFPSEDFLCQDPVPAVDHKLVEASDIEKLESMIRSSDLSIADRIKTAWAAAASFRSTDRRGGVNGARVRLEPQVSWEVNEPELLNRNLAVLGEIQNSFNASQTASGRRISLADLIVLAGNTAVEDAAQRAGSVVEVPFTPGRTDASQAQTDVSSFRVLKVTADGFRNFYDEKESYLSPLKAFVDRADYLDLDLKEVVVLTGGLRVLGANYKGSTLGMLTQKPGALSNDYFRNLLDPSLQWKKMEKKGEVYVGTDTKSGEAKWKATAQDLIFGVNPDMRLVSFGYANVAAQKKFVSDFVEAWTKVMNLDRFDIKR